MSPRSRAFLVASLCFAAHGVAANAEPDESRTVTIDVVVRDSAGIPIPDVGLAVRPGPMSRFAPSGPSITDPDGRAALAIEVPISHTSIEIVPCAAVRRPPSASESRGAMTRYWNLKRSHSFREKYPLTLDPVLEQYTLTIVTRPAITVSGRLVDAGGAPISSGTVRARSCECLTPSRRDGDDIGAFELVGVPRGGPAQLLISATGRIGRFLHLTAEQTQADLDLGDIALQPIMGAAKATLRSPGADPPRPGSIGMHTLISEDGETIITIIVDASDGQPRTPWLEPGQGWLPPGRYYVLPNSIGFGGDDTGWLLLDLIRAGKAPDHPELPSFVAAPNEETAVTVDPEDVRAKIKAAALAEGMFAE